MKGSYQHSRVINYSVGQIADSEKCVAVMLFCVCLVKLKIRFAAVQF